MVCSDIVFVAAESWHSDWLCVRLQGEPVALVFADGPDGQVAKGIAERIEAALISRRPTEEL